MTKKSWHRQALQEEASRKDREINLAKAALLIAAEEYPEIDIRRYLERLDEAAERVHSIAKPEADCFEMLGA
ncbi:MAG TPA: hypothetical protein VNL15_08055, partial [Dehalococcoidia bacterium]|nr:hypothetical protein [Dehalococcoidia bacterium]